MTDFLQLTTDDYLLQTDDTSKLILEAVAVVKKWFDRNRSIQQIILKESEWL